MRSSNPWTPLSPEESGKAGKKVFIRRTMLSMTEEDEFQLAMRVVKLTHHALKFHPSSRLYRRSTGKIRELLRSPHIYKPAQLRRLEAYYKQRTAILGSTKKRAQNIRTRHTLRALNNYQSNLKRMFRDIEDMNFPPTQAPLSDAMSRSDEDSKLFRKLSSWVPPMSPCEVDQPLFGDSYLEKIQRWASFMAILFPQYLLYPIIYR